MAKPKSVGRLPLISAHDVPVLLHEERIGARGVHGDVVDAVTDVGLGVGDVLRVESLIDGLPGLAAVVGAEGSGGRDGDVDALWIAGVEDDGVQAHAPRAGLPARAGAVFAEAGDLVPVLAAVGAAEDGGVFDSGVDGVGIGERGLEVPDALELPRMCGAVVPLVSAGNAFVGELVAYWVPCLAAVVGALDDLAEPATGLGGVDAIGINRRALEVIHLPACEVGAADVPLFPLAVGGEDEGAFARAD